MGMDKQGRLTKWEEWTIGEWYAWEKGLFDTIAHPMKCIEVNRRDGFIRFETGTIDIHRQFNWQRRFVHVKIEADEATA
jgi:hypothetical protein